MPITCHHCGCEIPDDERLDHENMKRFNLIFESIKANDKAAYPYKLEWRDTLSKPGDDTIVCGWSILRGVKRKYFLIQLAKDASNCEAYYIETLLEEVAHARTRSHLHDAEETAWATDGAAYPRYHNAAFWVEYGRLRGIYLGER